MGRGAHRPCGSRSQTRSQARHSLAVAASGPGCRLGCQQFPTRVLGSRRRYRVRARRRQYGDRKSASGASWHQRTGRADGSRKCSGMWSAGRSFFAPVRQRCRRWNLADETSAGESWRLYRLSHRGKNIDGRCGLAPRADSFLCGNEQHESRIHPAGRITRTWRQHCGGPAHFVYSGRRPVLHQARNGFSSGQ